MDKKKINKTHQKNNITNKTKNDNVVKLKTNFSSKNLICIQKLKVIVIVTLIIFILLIIRIGYLQFVDGAHLKELAYKQQTINQIISPKRGNIYDSTGKALAISAQVDTITINPTKITDKDDGKAKAL